MMVFVRPLMQEWAWVCESLTFQERARKPGGGKGILIQDERTGALSTLNNQSVVYGMSAYDSNSMKSSNPHSGIYEADTTRTLDNNGGNPACNQGGMMVVQGADVYNGDLTGEVAATLTEACGGTNTSGAKVVCLEGNGSRPSHQGDGYAESEICGGKGILIANERTGLLGTSANQFVCGVDNYNQAITGNVSKPLTNKATDSDHIPCVCYSQDAYDKYAESDTSAAIKQSGGNYGGGSESLVACVQEIIRE